MIDHIRTRLDLLAHDKASAPSIDERELIENIYICICNTSLEDRRLSVGELTPGPGFEIKKVREIHLQ